MRGLLRRIWSGRAVVGWRMVWVCWWSRTILSGIGGGRRGRRICGVGFGGRCGWGTSSGSLISGITVTIFMRLICRSRSGRVSRCRRRIRSIRRIRLRFGGRRVRGIGTTMWVCSRVGGCLRMRCCVSVGRWCCSRRSWGMVSAWMTGSCTCWCLSRWSCGRRSRGLGTRFITCMMLVRGGLRYFKEQAGFAPFDVHWELGRPGVPVPTFAFDPDNPEVLRVVSTPPPVEPPAPATPSRKSSGRPARWSRRWVRERAKAALAAVGLLPTV